MNKNHEELQEQDHPLKDTDKAFVQVGKDGEPVIPRTTEENARTSKEESEPVVYDKP